MLVLSIYRGLIDAPDRRSMREVCEAVAKAHGLTLEELRGDARCRRISKPRQEAMAVIHAQGRFSYPQIGRYFNRDHTTVLHAVRVHAERAACVEQAREAA